MLQTLATETEGIMLELQLIDLQFLQCDDLSHSLGVTVCMFSADSPPCLGEARSPPLS